jgi:hypothetical protein
MLKKVIEIFNSNNKSTIQSLFNLNEESEEPNQVLHCLFEMVSTNLLRTPKIQMTTNGRLGVEAIDPKSDPDEE